MSGSKLFQPTTVGPYQLQHRIVLAPLTRCRARADHVHNTPLALQYYDQRSSVPGTLLISEAIVISAKAGGLPHVPTIETTEQIESWKTICQAVHRNHCFFFAQLWAQGRSADANLLKAEGNFDVVSASDVPLSQGAKPRALSIPGAFMSVKTRYQRSKRLILT